MFLWKLGKLKYNRNKIKIKKTVSYRHSLLAKLSFENHYQLTLFHV